MKVITCLHGSSLFLREYTVFQRDQQPSKNDWGQRNDKWVSASDKLVNHETESFMLMWIHIM